MPGISAWNKDTSFSKAPGVVEPTYNWSTVGLEGWFDFTGDLNACQINHAHFKPDGTLVGAPVIGSNFLTFKSETSWLQTQMIEPPNCTIIAVCRWPANLGVTPKGVVVSNLGGTSLLQTGASNGTTCSVGGGVSSLSPIIAYLDAGYWNGSAYADISTTMGVAAPGTWRCLVYLFGAGGIQVTDVGTGNTNVASTAYVRDPDTLPFRIGSDYNGSLTGTIDMAQWAGFSRVLSPAEYVGVYGQFRDTMNAKSIAI